MLRTGLLEKFSHKSLLNDKQRLVYQNLLCSYKSLFYLDKEKHKRAIIPNALGCELRGGEGFSAITSKRSLNCCYNGNDNLYKKKKNKMKNGNS